MMSESGPAEHSAVKSKKIKLQEDISNNDKCIIPLAEKLKDSKMLPGPTLRAIKNPYTDTYTKATSIVDSVLQNIEYNPSVFNTFTSHLRDVGLSYLAKLVEDDLKYRLAKSKSGLQQPPSATGGDEMDWGMDEGETFPVLTLLPQQHTGAVSSTKGFGDKKSLVVLITNTYTSSVKPLHGVLKDRSELYKTFSDSQYFDVIRKEDAVESEMKEAVREAIQCCKNNEYKCAVIVFSGHGGKDSYGSQYLVANDGKPISAKKFIPSIVKTINVPKIVLIDACRGDKSPPKKGPGDNCLIAYGTRDDYTSLCPEKKGSYWIKNVAECFRENPHLSVVEVLDQAKENMKKTMKRAQSPVIEENSLADQSLAIFSHLGNGKGVHEQKKKKRRYDNCSSEESSSVETDDEGTGGDEVDYQDQDQKPTVRELISLLKELNKWEKFGENLPGIESYHIERIKLENTSDIEGQKRALFGTWLSIDVNASWETVAKALDEADKDVLAESIRQKKRST